MMKTNVCYLVTSMLLAGALTAEAQTKKFIDNEFNLVIQIDTLIFRDTSTVVDAKRFDSLATVASLKLKKHLATYKLKKKDLLLVYTFIYKAQLVARFSKMVGLNELGEFSNASKRTRLELLRDYADASARIHARFQPRYNKIKKEKK